MSKEGELDGAEVPLMAVLLIAEVDGAEDPLTAALLIAAQLDKGGVARQAAPTPHGDKRDMGVEETAVLFVWERRRAAITHVVEGVVGCRDKGQA